MKDSKAYEIHFLFEGVSPVPNGVITINGDKIDFVVLEGKVIFSDPELDKEMVKKISEDLKAKIALTTYRIKKN